MHLRLLSSFPIAITLLISSTTWAKSACLPLHSASTTTSEILSKMKLYEDVEKTAVHDAHLSLETTLKNIENLPERSVANLSGYKERRIWSVLCVQNETAMKRFVLRYSYPSMQKIAFFLYDTSGNLVSQQVSGKLIPLAQRQLKDTEYLFDFEIPAKAPFTIVMRFESTSSMQFPLSIVTRETLHELTQTKFLVTGIYYGIVLLILVFSFFLFVAFRGKLYLSYFLYILSVVAAQMSLQGIAFRYLWPDQVEWNKVATIFFVNLMFLALSFFTAVSLETPFRLRRFNWVLQGFAIIASCLAIIAIVSYGTTVVKLTGVLTSVLPLVVLPVGISAWRNGIAFGRFYLLAVLFYIVGASAYGLKDAGFLSPSLLTENGILIGSILEILVFTVGLVMKMKQVAKGAEQLRTELEIQSALSDLATQVSHDIRSPLSALNVSVAAFEQSPGEAQEVIQRSIRRINTITDELLIKYRAQKIPASKQQISKIKRKIRTVEMNSLVQKIINEKKIEFLNRENLKIQFDVSSSPATRIKISESDLARILSNLINNAAEACPSGGTITVYTRTSNSEGMISVVDDGTGMSLEILNRLGEKGFSAGTKFAAGGTGLGIWHAKQTLAVYGANLTIQSQLGTGTMITIAVPLLNRANLKKVNTNSDLTL